MTQLKMPRVAKVAFYTFSALISPVSISPSRLFIVSGAICVGSIWVILWMMFLSPSSFEPIAAFQ